MVNTSAKFYKEKIRNKGNKLFLILCYWVAMILTWTMSIQVYLSSAIKLIFCIFRTLILYQFASLLVCIEYGHVLSNVTWSYPMKIIQFSIYYLITIPKWKSTHFSSLWVLHDMKRKWYFYTSIPSVISHVNNFICAINCQNCSYFII